MKKLLYLLSTLILLSSCMDDKDLLADLHHAETVMETHPDSAYQLLVVHDSLQVSQQSRETRMRHQLLMAEATNKLYLQMPSDTLFQEVVDYYDHHGTPNQQLKAHYLLGCIYRDRGEAPMALQCYYDAVEKADTLSKDCDYTTMYKIYGQMADVYDKQYMPYEEIEVLNKVQVYAQKAGSTFSYIKGHELMCRPYLMLRDSSRVLKITDEAYRLYKKHGLLGDAGNIYASAIYIYMGRGEYQKAKEQMNLFEEHSNFFKQEYPDPTTLETYKITKGLYYVGTNQFLQAKSIFYSLLCTPFRMEACEGLLKIFKEEQQQDSILKYWQLYDDAFERRYTELYFSSMHQVAAMYDYTRNQKIATSKEKEAERNLFFLILSVVVFSISTVGIYLGYRHFKIVKLQEIFRLHSNFITTQNRCLKLESELINMHDKYSDSLSTKQEELKNLRQRLQVYKRQYDKYAPDEKYESLVRSDIVIAFQEMTKPRYQQELPTSSDWENLMLILQQSFPKFYAILTQKGILSRQELQTTVLTYLGFLSGDIAILLNTTVQRITNAKSSANEKLFSKKGATSFANNLKHLQKVKSF